MVTVIVFGPTGNIASVAARTAEELGAKVVLAMRDPSKTIAGLSAEQEKAGAYERVKADLNDPDSLTAAVQKTGATRAFIYVVWGQKDHMRASLSALKAAGIEFVVFLSSFTVSGNLTDFTPTELIPYAHAQVEISLNEVYGDDKYVAIRPGGFATNHVGRKAGIAAGEVRMFGGGFEADNVTPGDMGRVSGNVLVNGPKEGQKKVYVYGPQIMSYKDSVITVGKVLGKDVKVTPIDEEECRKQMAEEHVPPPLIDYMVKHLAKVNDGGALGEKPEYEQGVKNVELYTGKKSTPFEEWVGQNKELFAV